MKLARVLVVDDDRDHADAIAEVLQIDGHEVTPVYTGHDALAQVAATPFDIVLLDYKLPDMDGLEAMARMRAARPGVRILVMTGFRIEHLLGSSSATPRRVRVARNPNGPEEVLAALNDAGREGVVLVAGGAHELPEQMAQRLEREGRRVARLRPTDDVPGTGLPDDVDVLVVDAGGTVLDGLARYTELTRNREGLPVVFLVGGGQVAGADPLRSTAVTGCLFKPVDLGELCALVRRSSRG